MCWVETVHSISLFFEVFFYMMKTFLISHMVHLSASMWFSRIIKMLKKFRKCKCFSNMLEIFLENQYLSQIKGFRYFLKFENVETKFLELTYSQRANKNSQYKWWQSIQELTCNREKKRNIKALLHFYIDVRNISGNFYGNTWNIHRKIKKSMYSWNFKNLYVD